MKILVITPKLPWPAHGADEQDRLEGIRLFIEMGHQVSVIAKVASYQMGKADEMSHALGVPVTAVPYSDRSRSLVRFTDLRWLDGAAFEYREPGIIQALESALTSRRPDLVWLDGSFSWPLIPQIKKHGIRVAVRSLQIESSHVLVDEGYTIPNLVRWVGKELGERMLAREADVIVAINRHEERRYRAYGAPKTVTVPLRSLPAIVSDTPIEYRAQRPLHVLFSGSTFSVAHNRAGAETVLRDIAPRLEAAAPGGYVIHMTGAKLSVGHVPPNVRLEGYVPNFSAFVRGMDIAIAPGLGSVGMHQKLYDPISRGIPVVAAPWALAGYPFDGVVTPARSVEDYVTALMMLNDVGVRERLGRQGRMLATEHFSKQAVENALSHAVE